MRPRVVYLVGAGFSAPLGIPVVRDFISRSKDLYADDPGRFASFRSVFDLIKELTFAKTYYRTETLNIEEVLSLLELGEFAEGQPNRDRFVQFLADVINATTPPPPVFTSSESVVWEEWFLGTQEPWRSYALFVASLRGLSLSPFARGGFQRERILNPPATYGVISLNYDTVLETASGMIDLRTVGQPGSEMAVVTTNPPPADAQLVVAKLHGSISDGSIVPPTWNKGARTDVSPAWKAAVALLRSANYIRILGYSLPETDSYVRFLLKYAGAHCEHLKGIDVVCQDPDGSVAARYKSFVVCPLRFAGGDLTWYAGKLSTRMLSATGPSHKVDPVLEAVHEEYMDRYASA